MKNRYILRHWSYLFTLALLLAVAACSGSGQTISETSIEERIAALNVGQSTKADVERILGTGYTTDRNSWAYNFSDTQFDLSERKQGPGLGIIPVSAGVVPTNTRAVVSVAFNDSALLKRLEVTRLFDQPFINDYWYALTAGDNGALEAIAKLGENAGMKVVGLDKDARTFTLEDNGTRGKIMVKTDGNILHLTSRNPHHRLTSEYRAYAKRESALVRRIAETEIVQ